MSEQFSMVLAGRKTGAKDPETERLEPKKLPKATGDDTPLEFDTANTGPTVPPIAAAIFRACV